MPKAQAESPDGSGIQHHRLGTAVTATVAGLLLAGIGLALVLAGGRLWHYFRNPGELRILVQSWSAWAPLGIVAVQVIQIVVAPLPGNVVSFVAGYACGFWPAILWVMVGVLVGATVDFLLARALGRRLLRYLMPARRLARLDSLVVRKGTFYLFLLLLIPNPVGDLAYYLAGLTPLPLPVFLVLVLAGRLPSNLIECSVGSRATRFGWVEWGILAAAVAVLTAFYFLNQQRIAQLLERWSRVGRFDSR